MCSEERRSMETNRYRVTLLELGGDSGVPMKHHLIEEAPLTGAGNWGLRAEGLVQGQTQKSFLDIDKPGQVSWPPASTGLLLPSTLPAKILPQETELSADRKRRSCLYSCCLSRLPCSNKITLAFNKGICNNNNKKTPLFSPPWKGWFPALLRFTQHFLWLHFRFYISQYALPQALKLIIPDQQSTIKLWVCKWHLFFPSPWNLAVVEAHAICRERHIKSLNSETVVVKRPLSSRGWTEQESILGYLCCAFH